LRLNGGLFSVISRPDMAGVRVIFLIAPDATMTKARTALFAGTLVMIMLLVGACFGEMAVRRAAPQQLFEFRPDLFQPHDGLGWTFRPHVSARINTGDGWATIYTDARGFRVGARGPLDGDHEILLLGDSFMAAIQVDHEQTLAGLMEADLSERFGRVVAVRNAAVPAWDPPHYLARSRHLIRDGVKPDLVIVAVYLGNDIVDWRRDRFEPVDPTPRPRFRTPRGIGARELTDALARPLDFGLRERSHLYVLGRKALTSLRMRVGLSTIYFPGEYLADAAGAPRWQITAGLLAEIAALWAEQDAPTLFVLIPPDFQVDPSILHRHAAAFGIDASAVAIDQPNHILGGLLRAEGLDVLDPTPALRAASRAGRATHGRVDSHFSADGHAVTWSYMQRAVEGFIADG
jgi:hypothetical protein